MEKVGWRMKWVHEATRPSLDDESRTWMVVVADFVWKNRRRYRLFFCVASKAAVVSSMIRDLGRRARAQVFWAIPWAPLRLSKLILCLRSDEE